LGLTNKFHTYFNERGCLKRQPLFYAMNTSIEVVLCGIKTDGTLIAFNEIYEEINRIGKMLNRFNPDSEVSQINRHQSRGIKIRPELCAIIEQCKLYNELTKYFFDVCINNTRPVAPGMKDFIIDTTYSTIQPLKSILNFDFGAFAKGYAIDRVKTILGMKSGSNALVIFGNSSILALGHHPCGICLKISL